MMTKKMLTISFALVLIIALLSCSHDESNDVFLFSYFKGNGEDGLHLAYSYDGLIWKALNNDQSFLKPEVGKAKLMRDPCIVRSPDNIFHMVWTAGWWENGIGMAHSKNLIEWSEQQLIPVMKHEPDAVNCWAPEIFYDEMIKQYIIYWSTTIPDRFPETASSSIPCATNGSS